MPPPSSQTKTQPVSGVGGNEGTTGSEKQGTTGSARQGTTGSEEVKERPKERKRDVLRRLFGDEAQKRRMEREIGGGDR